LASVETVTIAVDVGRSVSVVSPERSAAAMAERKLGVDASVAAGRDFLSEMSLTEVMDCWKI
jgi:hypothetical protein